MAESAKMPGPAQEGGGFKCPSCGGSQKIKDHGSGEVICATCGCVAEEKSFDRGPEWRAFDQEERENKSRGGPPKTETIHDKGLSTQIDYKNRDSRGNSLPAEKRAQMSRLRKWHKRSKVKDAKDRNLTVAFGELNRLSSQLGLPKSVKEEAGRIYRKAVERGLIRGRSIEGMISAVVYLECRREDIPRTLSEVTEVSRADAKKIGSNQRFIERELGTGSGSTDPVDLVSRFGSRLNLSGETRREAIDLIREAQQKGITSGKSPRGTAAGVLYMACYMTGEERTQKKVSVVAGVTDVTVRNRYKELERELGIQPKEREKVVPKYGEEPPEERSGGEKPDDEKPDATGIGAEAVKCENVVASVTFEDTRFDLEKLADSLNADYRPDKFPGVSYSLEGTEATFLIFEPGKANCVGTSSLDDARTAPKLLAERLESEGFKVDPDPKVEIRNIVVQTNFGVAIDLEELHGPPFDTSYDPGSFPGLHMRLEEPDVDFLLFANGGSILHAGREGDIEPALEKMIEVLQELEARGS